MTRNLELPSTPSNIIQFEANLQLDDKASPQEAQENQLPLNELKRVGYDFERSKAEAAQILSILRGK